MYILLLTLLPARVTLCDTKVQKLREDTTVANKENNSKIKVNTQYTFRNFKVKSWRDTL